MSTVADYFPGRAWGPDVSHYAPVHDWDALTASGATFLGAKASEGVHTVDGTFLANLAQFRARPSFTRGVWYHLFHCTKDPTEQADLLMSMVGALKLREQLCLDFERASYLNIDADALRRHGLDWIEAFFARLDQVGALGNTRGVVYTSKADWDSIGNPTWDRAASLDLWIPRYCKPPKEPDALPGPWAGWSIFQFTDGKDGVPVPVPGIGLCDVNVLEEK